MLFAYTLPTMGIHKKHKGFNGPRAHTLILKRKTIIIHDNWKIKIAVPDGNENQKTIQNCNFNSNKVQHRIYVI